MFYAAGFASVEGIRGQSILTLLAFLPYSIYFFVNAYFFNTFNNAVEKPLPVLLLTIQGLAGVLLNCYLSYYTGSGDLTSATKLINGRYQVGVQEFRTQLKDNAALVFYPMDSKTFDK